MDYFEVHQQLDELDNRIAQMPGHIIFERIEGLRRSVLVFRGNAQELTNLVEEINKPDKVSVIVFPGNNPEYKTYLQEITRLFHNFVASAFSLVEHARVIYKTVHTPLQRFPEYETEVKARFVKNPLARFVQDMRNFCLHKELPVFWSRYTFKRGGDIQARIHFVANDLLKWDNLSKEARQYIASVSNEIDMYQVVIDYAATVEGFYQWLFRRLGDIYTHETKAVNQAIRERNLLWAKTLPFLIERIRFDGGGKVSKWSLMNNLAVGSVIPPEIFRRAVASSQDPIQQAGYIINHLEELGPLPEDSKETLISAFIRVKDSTLEDTPKPKQ
jgi:hypothetical protein